MGEPAPLMSRAALGRVLRSLLLHERDVARGRRGSPVAEAVRRPSSWSEDLRFSDHGAGSLGCDSLETLHLAAAVNEMFHLYEAGDEANLLTTDTFGGWLDHVEAAWWAGVSRVTFATSGSTGRPKRCSHVFAHLDVEVEYLAARFADRRRIVALAPAHHIYGFLFTALLPDRLGVDVWLAERASPGELARGVLPGDLVVSFPTSWRWLERTLPAWPDDVVGVTSTAPCPGPLVAALSQRGLARMVEVYGSSETAGIATREALDAPFQLMPHWRFGSGGDECATTLVHRSGLIAALADVVHRQGDDLFRLAGRLDGAVQVGGMNVHPTYVAERLREHPSVREAVVRLMRPEEGDRLKAFVVPAAFVDLDRLSNDLLAWADDTLPAPDRPKSMTFGPELPVSTMGKPADW